MLAKVKWWMHYVTIMYINRGVAANNKELVMYIFGMLLFGFLSYSVIYNKFIYVNGEFKYISILYAIVMFYLFLICVLFILGRIFRRRYELKAVRDYDFSTSWKHGWYAGGVAVFVSALLKYFGS